MTIGERLRFLRGELSLTQPSAATKFSIPLGTWKQYEKGPSEPGSGALRGLAEGGVNVNWLLTGLGSVMIAKYMEMPLSAELDTKRLQLAIETIEEVLEESGRTITTAKKAEAIKLAYEIFEDEDKEKDEQSFEHAQKIIYKIIKSIT